ncbi:hypothetical protein XI07_13250 [Bradyrhizobium sp. CCBAU 11445]|nr:hypothetical protein [Bradyrhizobium sp. CCBAU 25360]MDA9450177.1 hypothetical protein [Bradyrhizobium sp. CCBAU 21360]MDA9455545.1 hypothetical protein [Bradyrhizobium sp. CCBAU 21359]MDA9473066.1 hypothetical protein [Bradyrhizobium sp. CCBAU 65884]MDA9482976.1 hypothetical protein [Bradyrhizobium sp. CCBAU 11445]MDA9516074.1 hypothetical protein [Bradyrhizobium sp. CCBAU 11430]
MLAPATTPAETNFKLVASSPLRKPPIKREPSDQTALAGSPGVVGVRQNRSSRPLHFFLFREAFQDLDAELFRGRALELPELVPEPDHFALFFDGHESTSQAVLKAAH